VILLTVGSASAWGTWEAATSKLVVDPEYIKRVDDPKW
jgi:proline iminopeptidase